MNYQQFLLNSERKVKKINNSGGYEMQCVSSHHGIPLSVIQENVLIAKSIET